MTTVDDYLLDADKPDWPKLLADWRPLLPYEFSIWLMNRFGDLFIVRSFFQDAEAVAPIAAEEAA